MERDGSVMRGTLAVLTLAASTANAAPTLESITFPIDVVSIGVALGVAGATVLLIVFGLFVGFVPVRRLVRQATMSVDGGMEDWDRYEREYGGS